jgi:Peptidase A4 family
VRKLFRAAVVFMLVVSAAPSAATGEVGVRLMPGWAGYLVRAGAGSFTEVRGRWVQPRVVCNRPGSAVAFWIGLGGARRQSRALEQVGTSADCSSRAELSYSAWYQLWPGRVVELPVAIGAGDIIESALSVNDATVSISLRNLSTGEASSQSATMWLPETDSAEWIVEAPAMCFLSCTLLPLATFDRVRFTQTSATAGGHLGTIADANWGRSRLQMGVSGRRPLATPSPLVEGGSAFAVTRRRRLG